MTKSFWSIKNDREGVSPLANTIFVQQTNQQAIANRVSASQLAETIIFMALLLHSIWDLWLWCVINTAELYLELYSIVVRKRFFCTWLRVAWLVGLCDEAGVHSSRAGQGSSRRYGVAAGQAGVALNTGLLCECTRTGRNKVTVYSIYSLIHAGPRRLFKNCRFVKPETWTSREFVFPAKPWQLLDTS